MEFWYRLAGTGGAEAGIIDEVGHALLTATYLSDALGDLLEAVGLLLEGAAESRCSWEDEPGEYRWIFARTPDDSVSLTVLEFRDQYPSLPDDQGLLAFRTIQPLPVLAAAIADGAAAVLAEHGEEGYKRQWLEDPFPTARLAMIRERLAAR